MTLRSRSCVIGRGVAMFSICSAMAFASKMPTQIGSTRWPSLSRRITIGMLVIGSTISPLIDISICIELQPRRRGRACQIAGGGRRPIADHGAPDAVRTGPLHPDPGGPADPLGRSRQVDHDVVGRTA